MSFSLCVSWRWGKKGVFVHSGEAAPVQVLPRGGQEGMPGGRAGRAHRRAGGCRQEIPRGGSSTRVCCGALRGPGPLASISCGHCAGGQCREGRRLRHGLAGGCGGLPGGGRHRPGIPLGSRGFPPFPATAGPGTGRLRPEPCRAGHRAGWPLPAGKKAGIPVQKEVGSRGPFVKLRDRPKRRIPAAVAGIGMLRDGRERLREDACRHVPACRENAGRLHRSPRV